MVEGSFCFACELQFGTGYPELGVLVPLVIVYLISYLNEKHKAQQTILPVWNRSLLLYERLLQHELKVMFTE